MSDSDSETKPQPNVNESELDILKVKFQSATMEIEKLNKENVMLKLENETLRREHEKNTNKVAKSPPNPDDPTEDESKVLEQMQPSDRKVDVSNIAQLVGVSITTAQHYLNELTVKGYIHNAVTPELPGVRPKTSTYTLTSKGIKFLVEHSLVK